MVTESGANPPRRENESDEDDIDEDVFAVEKILGKRVVSGKLEYKIRWMGFDGPQDDTWEPEENLHCAELIQAYERRQERREQEEQLMSQFKML
ncbi:heterochromatin protein 1 alpha [Aphelenchoides avenae]|nr:heterochromatin protein 1 alpha [Aphelenchus avenae]